MAKGPSRCGRHTARTGKDRVQRKLLDVVAGEFLTEGGGRAILILGLIQAGNGGIQSGAGHQILLEGHLVGGVGLRLGTGAEAYAGNAITALDGNAVGRCV